MSHNTKPKYMGAALPGNGAVVTLFSTVDAFPGKNYLAMFDLSRLEVSIKNDQAGTLKGYRSVDRGVTWTQIMADTSVAIPATGSTTFYDLLIGEYEDYQLTWTNGATPQTLFGVDMLLVKGHVKST